MAQMRWATGSPASLTCRTAAPIGPKVDPQPRTRTSASGSASTARSGTSMPSRSWPAEVGPSAHGSRSHRRCVRYRLPSQCHRCGAPRPGARDRPRSSQGLGVPQVGPELLAAVLGGVVRPGGEGDRKVGEANRHRDAPRLRTVGEVAVGEQDDRRPIGGGYPRHLQRGVEAVGRGLRRDDRHRRFTVATEHGLQQVGLFGFGGKSGGRTATLHVHDDQGSSIETASPMVSDFRDRPGPEVVVTPSAPPNEAPAQRRFRRSHPRPGRSAPEVLVLAQFVQDVAGRGDRVTGQEQREPRLPGRGDEPVGQRQIAADVSVAAGASRAGGDLVLDREVLRRVAV